MITVKKVLMYGKIVAVTVKTFVEYQLFHKSNEEY